ncbi:hypothetical protein A3218_05610 [Pseudomonas chlororaphis]|uniref:Ig-like domain-containing protein n=1 Tax=Pseudomonas chlororaphis TaxID=587753 RepID=UPI000789E100|nr:Ig-like domain-containing protein [Pseudomonas chlororaphis]AMS13797.1 hypothetical protein A3218_05610 [Pseudomonas chlororaphis]
MAATRYIINQTANREVLDFRPIGAKYTLDGVEYDYATNADAEISGNGLPNTVWTASGASIDARQLLGGTDVVLFGGKWADYTKTLDTVAQTITFNRTVDGHTEQVIVANGHLTLQKDLLVFADGAVRTDTAHLALTQNLGASVDDLKAQGALTTNTAADDWNASITSSHPGTLLPDNPGGSIFAIAAAPTNFALPTPGVTQVLSGSGGVDQVYITAGSTVDARQLLGGEDRIFFTGKWADYTKTLDAVAQTITFNRTVDGHTEQVIVANGHLVMQKDLLVFADGAVRTDTARLALTQNLGASVDDLKAQGALTTNTAADDWKMTTFTRWGVKAPMIDAVTSDDKVNSSEKQAGVLVSGSADANSKIQLEWGGVQKSVTAGADGKWSATFSNTEVPADGKTVLSVSAVDSTGYVSAPATRDVLVDTAAPVAAVVQPIGGDGKINAQEKHDGIVIAGTAEPGSTVTVNLGGVPKTVPVDSNGNWQVPYSDQELPADGNPVMKIIVTDPAGNVTSKDVPLVIDTTVAAPVINAVATDDIVNATEKTAGVNVAGTAEDGSSVKVVWGTAEHTVKADADGKWSSTFAPADIPADGNTSISAVATDVAGNVSTAGTHAVKVDTVVAVPTIAIVAGDDIVSATEKTAGVNVSGTAEDGSSVAVTWGGAVHTVTADADGKWSSNFTATEIPADGSTSISAVATDGAGNVSTAGTHAVKVDTISSAPVIDAVTANNIVNAAEKAAGVSVTGTAETGSSVKVTWGSAVHTVTAAADGKWSSNFTATEIPADGSTPIKAIATDVVGNISTQASRAVLVDTVVAPPIFTDLALYNDKYINAFNKRRDLTVFKGTAEVGTSLDVTLGNTVHHVEVMGDGSWTTTFTAAEIPADGATVLSAVVTDNAGNSATAQRNLIVDTTAPANATVDPITSDNVVNATEKAAGLTVTGTAEANCRVRVGLFSGIDTGTGGDATVSQEVYADSTGHWTAHFTPAQVPNDTFAAGAVSFDLANNIQSETHPLHRFTYDTEVAAPTISVVATDDIVNATEKTAGVNVSGTADADSSVAVTWGTAVHTVTADADGKWSSTFAQADIPADGNTSISAVATDVAGNVSTAGTHAVKVDTAASAPVINDVTDDNIINAAEKSAGVKRERYCRGRQLRESRVGHRRTYRESRCRWQVVLELHRD